MPSGEFDHEAYQVGINELSLADDGMVVGRLCSYAGYVVTATGAGEGVVAALHEGLSANTVVCGFMTAAGLGLISLGRSTWRQIQEHRQLGLQYLDEAGL